MDQPTTTVNLTPDSIAGTTATTSPINVLLSRLAQMEAKGRPKPSPGAFGGKNRLTGKQGWKRRPTRE